ncbi:bifunctional DNA-formamidopyrimidine glycosylase/DNA-(apurinic or apyrimidinic site) lyase [Aurantimonas sp. Leaf443]|uniref:bifunctional DNA-formamidopyrimidine glycosylase/DNA-(apurinic or apyrimidinic site) lyase n=1 Tax=Aurantimonas sp. Leaf443 TaxID=1736378 RepID=UPI0006F376F7|nr:bifunctional DNA-formamidopyrimidine glycosylase/DNA-(apurinic or apyrimidinic site) lyase [Aurantimonas sp. Leaf443]KQT83906.1 5-hydroxymethyluracil DNA glycosylase [Aurantimonas sp. Leaf443]
MPELPEVETVRRGLAPVMEGARIEAVALARADLRFPFPERFGERLAGRRILSLSRRAKYLLADLSGEERLAMHLGMSGSFRIEVPEGTLVPGAFHIPRSEARLHDHVRFSLTRADGTPATIVFNDPRRFGSMTLLGSGEFETHRHFARLGIEPTGNALSGAALAPFLMGRAAPLKAVLLDQTIVAGLGNIYVCEALWRAKLSPRRAAGTLVRADGRPTERLERLATEIRATIADAIEAGGSTLRDYRQADGSLGYFQHRFAVYDREDEPCPRPACRGVVARLVQSGRSTFFCPQCQR